MLTILIVDDEYRDRQGMTNIINRQGWPVKTKEASAGKIAMDILHNSTIDILITDIRMPDMLGTDLAALAVLIQPKIKIIFISAYKDFEYARQALKTGAANYLLKPYLIEDFILSVYSILEKCIEAQSESLNRTDNRIFDQLSQDRLLNQFLNNPSDESLQSSFEAVTGDFSDGIQPVAVELLNSKSELSVVTVQKLLNNIFKSRENFFCINKKRCFLLLGNPDNFFPSDLLTQKMIETFSNELHSDICIAYGSVMHKTSELSGQYDLISKTLEMCFFIDKSIALEASEQNVASFENDLHISTLSERIAFKVLSKEYDSVRADLNGLFDYFKLKKRLSPLYLKYISSDIINKIFLKINIQNLEVSMQKWITKIFEIQSVGDIYSVFDDLIPEIQEINENSDNPQLINAIYHIIESDYMKDINLDTIAKKLYISSSYLSHLFKKETGQNLIDYLKNHRLKKSCDLLKNTNLRISQICSKIGYESTSYYCSLFKTTYGMTPIQYRKRSGIKKL